MFPIELDDIVQSTSLVYINGIMFFDGFYEMIHMLPSDIFDTKIVNYQ